MMGENNRDGDDCEAGKDKNAKLEVPMVLKSNTIDMTRNAGNRILSEAQYTQIDQKHKDFAKELFHLQNKARKEPKWAIKHLKSQIKRF
jgi:hypothetical protein